MASDRNDGSGQKAAVTRFATDMSVAAVLLACLAAVHGLDGSWLWGFRDDHSQRESAESQATGAAAGSGHGAAEEPPVAVSDESDGDSVDRPVTEASADDVAMPDANAKDRAPDAPEENDESVERKPTGIIAGFEAFKPEMLPVKPSMRPEFITPAVQPELIKQPPPPPVEDLVVGKPQPEKIEFFDTETKATSVGFVVDCSSSMDGAKFQAVCAELAKSITALKPEQKFFVVFFNESFFPMTGNSHQRKLLPANRENKKKILTFLASARSGGGTNPEPALQFMAGLQPEVIYLLTDGGFNPLSPVTYNNLAAARIVVHTIGFETGGTIPILQEIATRTSGTFRSAAMNGVSPGLFFADAGVVRSALSNADPNLRREAVSVALIRELPFVNEIITMLADSDSLVRAEVHDELRNLAQGTDFGPVDSGDVPDAIERWKLWWSLRKATRETLLGRLRGDDADARWVAASLARTSGLNAPDELIAVMRSAPSPVWQELHAALIQCCPGQDFGPAAGATPKQVVDAADRWAEWRVEEREREARERLAKRTKVATMKLKLARQLVQANPEAVVRRCREIMRDFGDTPVAAEAKKLLEEVDGDAGE